MDETPKPKKKRTKSAGPKPKKKKDRSKMSIEERKENFGFCLADDDSCASDVELHPIIRQLVDTMNECRDWFVDELGFLFKLMAEQGEALSVFFTRISTEESMDSETRRIRWIRLDYRLRALVVKIAKMFVPGCMPDKFCELMKYWV